MRRDFGERVQKLEAKVFELNVPIDFLGLWDPNDPDWEDVQLEGRLPEYAARLVFQRNKLNGKLRAFLNTPDAFPGGADLRFL
jgi:hypothetical protein